MDSRILLGDMHAARSFSADGKGLEKKCEICGSDVGAACIPTLRDRDDAAMRVLWAVARGEHVDPDDAAVAQLGGAAKAICVEVFRLRDAQQGTPPESPADPIAAARAYLINYLGYPFLDGASEVDLFVSAQDAGHRDVIPDLPSLRELLTSMGAKRERSRWRLSKAAASSPAQGSTAAEDPKPVGAPASPAPVTVAGRATKPCDLCHAAAGVPCDGACPQLPSERWPDPDEPAGAKPMRRGIYVASKAKHGPRWQALRDAGAPIVSTWIDESGEGETSDWAELWDRCIAEATTCAMVLVYVEEGEIHKGSLVEVGAALAAGVPVAWVGPEYSTAPRHRLVRRVASIDDALSMWEAIRPCPALSYAAEPKPAVARWLALSDRQRANVIGDLEDDLADVRHELSDDDLARSTVPGERATPAYVQTPPEPTLLPLSDDDLQALLTALPSCPWVLADDTLCGAVVTDASGFCADHTVGDPRPLPRAGAIARAQALLTARTDPDLDDMLRFLAEHIDDLDDYVHDGFPQECDTGLAALASFIKRCALARAERLDPPKAGT